MNDNDALATLGASPVLDDAALTKLRMLQAQAGTGTDDPLFWRLERLRKGAYQPVPEKRISRKEAKRLRKIKGAQ